MKWHFRHFCRGYRETRFSAKVPIRPLKWPAGQGGETAKLPAQRQKCRRNHELAFPEKVPIRATSRVTDWGSETEKLPAERQHYQCIREAAFPADPRLTPKTMMAADLRVCGLDI